MKNTTILLCASAALALGVAACSQSTPPNEPRFDLQSATAEHYGAGPTAPEEPNVRSTQRARLQPLALRPTGRDWRLKAERQCLASGLPEQLAYVRPGGDAPRIASGLGGFFSSFGRSNQCGAVRPLKVSAAAGGGVRLKPTATLACQMVPAVDAWVADVVQPAARRHFGQAVVELKVAASYGCRPRNNTPGAKMSEHSFANAIDFSAFKLADGRTVTVLEGWNGRRDESAFLRTIHRGACGIFSTVLGPNSDRYHRDHFHFDRAMHRRPGSSYCR